MEVNVRFLKFENSFDLIYVGHCFVKVFIAQIP